MAEPTSTTTIDPAAPAPAAPAPAVPAPTEPASAPASPAETAPAGARFSKRTAREQAAARAEALGQSMDQKAEPGEKPTGEPAPEPAPPVAGDQGTPAITEPASPPAAEAPKAPSAPITVTLDDQHPVAALGTKTIHVATPEEERVVKALIKGTYARRQEVTDLQQQVAERDRQLGEFRQQDIRRQSDQAAQQQWEQTPEYQSAVTEYRRMLELEEAGELGKGAATRYWAGVQGSLREVADREFTTRWGAEEARENERYANEFRRAAWGRMEHLPMAEQLRTLPEFPEWFEKGLRAFNAELEMGHFPQLRPGDVDALHREFTEFFWARLVKQPQVRQLHQRVTAQQQQQQDAAAQRAAEDTRSREEIERAAIERYKREIAEQNQTAPPHPLGKVASRSTPHIPDGEPRNGNLAAKTPNQARKQAMQSAMERAGRYRP